MYHNKVGLCLKQDKMYSNGLRNILIQKKIKLIFIYIIGRYICPHLSINLHNFDKSIRKQDLISS